MTISELKEKLSVSATKLAVRIGQQELLDQQLQSAIAQKSNAENDLDLFSKVQVLLQKTSDFARKQAKARIEELVTSALTVVFGRSYKFSIELDVKNNRPEASYFLENDGIKTQLKPPDYDRGGGAVDIICLALRLAIAELEKVTGTFLLDEIGKHVSAEYAPNVAYFLKEYSTKFNRQILLVTHNHALAEIGDIGFNISQKNGKSEVRKN